jgi:hypothetical protein
MTRLFHRLQLLFRPARPRAVWLRVLLALVGLVLMLALVAVALVGGLFWLAARLVWRAGKRPAPIRGAEGVIDGEYRVVARGNAALQSRNA